MKKIYRYLIAATCTVASLSSCTDYLDLKPEDKLLEEQVFSNARNINSYLNGIYVKLGGNALYGENLTLTIPDVLAQRYKVGGQHTFSRFSSYTYTDAGVAAAFSQIWSSAYSTIFNANRLIAGLDRSPGILDAKTDSIYRGEALAMRAMLHFDMLRLFGPVYNTADSTSTTIQGIPYCTQGVVTVNPFLPANEVMNHIMADLSKADSLLSVDKSMDFGKKYRFGYYSIKALEARINLYRGNKAAALACAKVIIDNSSKFPWVNRTDIISNKASADKIFSSEMILGAYNPDLYKESGSQLKVFASTLADVGILAPMDSKLSALFSGVDAVDWRFANDQLWARPASKDYKTFLKYADVEDKAKPFRNTIPLLKLSEMYYIAAECEPNPTIARDYLNIVRANRGLSVTTPVPASQAEILKEYQKEFFGEGQLWFYYKRMNVASLNKGDLAIGNVTPKYVVPVPTAEITNR